MRLRWRWLAVAPAFIIAGGALLAGSSTVSCASGEGVSSCSPMAADRVKQIVILLAALAGAAWALRRALRRG